MKRFGIIFVLSFILVGCAKTHKDMDRALAFRQEFLKQEGSIFSCELTADYGDILYVFNLECKSTKNGNVEFTVTSPDTISGISGTISGNGGNIRFEDAVLGYPLLSEDLPTPLSAPYLFITALQSGYIRTCDVVNGAMSLTIADTYEQDAILMQIEFNKEDKPVSCQYIWKGRRILSMQISSFAYL